MDFNSYQMMLASHGIGKRERVINKSKHDTYKLAPKSPAYKQVEIDDVPHDMMIISSTVTNQKIIRTMPGDDFNIGSILFWSGSHWLITERDADDEITVRGKIEVCKREVIWQNPDTLEIHSRWATVDKPYFSNLSENKRITYSSREFKLQFPFDEESSKIDIGKRLMLEIVDGKPKTYRVTSIDHMTERINRNDELVGFIIMNVEQDLYNAATDNSELMVCDYIEPENRNTTEDGQEELHLYIDYKDSPIVKAGGLGKKFTAVMDGETADAEWSVLELDSDETPTWITMDTSNAAFCKLICSDNVKLIGRKVRLRAVVDDMEASLEVEVMSL